MTIFERADVTYSLPAVLFRLPVGADFFLRHTLPQCRFNTVKLVKSTAALTRRIDIRIIVDDL